MVSAACLAKREPLAALAIVSEFGRPFPSRCQPAAMPIAAKTTATSTAATTTDWRINSSLHLNTAAPPLAAHPRRR
jgi:hypothetical protein